MVLTGKTIFITGANRGIGRAIAEKLAMYPVNLLLGMRDPSALQEIPGAKAKSIKAVSMDLSSKESIDRSLASFKDEIAGIDILINNAGQFVAGSLQKQDPDKLYSMFQTNIVGLSYLTARLLPTLLQRPEAKIVNNASIAGYAYFPYNSTYSATKAGVVAFSESLRRELVHSSVSVLHLVTPGVDTTMLADVEKTYQDEGKPLQLKKVPASTWAKKVVRAIETDKKMLSPSGVTEFLKIISHGPPALMDAVSRRFIIKN